MFTCLGGVNVVLSDGLRQFDSSHAIPQCARLMPMLTALLWEMELVLKLPEDACRDGDWIAAVIAASTVNHMGGYRVDAPTATVSDPTLEAASPSLLTMWSWSFWHWYWLGDPLEVNAVTQVLRLQSQVVLHQPTDYAMSLKAIAILSAASLMIKV